MSPHNSQHHQQNSSASSHPQQPPQQIDYSQPVAYDTNGQPLYAHPPQQHTNHRSPQVVQLARPLDPVRPHIGEEVMNLHRESLKAYPRLNLSEGEYVIRAVRRHPIGLVPTFSVAGLAVVLIAAGVGLYGSIAESEAGSMPSVAGIALIAFLLCTLILIGAFISVYVYWQNRFFLTNESVIQEIQHSIFSKHEQTVSLANIEDASYRQDGILQHLFNYGSIRLSTQGEETTYRFNYVTNPKDHIATLNNAVESFKNGRPVIP